MVRVLSAAVWMLVWWVSEAVPLGVTSVLPLVLFPTLGVADVSTTAAPYGSKFVFLFLGGFLIALALEQWNLHRRFALHILVAAGGTLERLLAGFMVATAALSMWISNTATTLMMLPIALSVLSKINLDDHPRFPVALLLGTAYAANLGGIATLVGTPPNVAMAGLVEEVGLEVPFLEWSMMALPFSALMLALVARLADTGPVPRVVQPVGGRAEALRSKLQALGRWSQAERRVAWVFAATALLWVARRALVTLGRATQRHHDRHGGGRGVVCPPFRISTRRGAPRMDGHGAFAVGHSAPFRRRADPGWTTERCRCVGFGGPVGVVRPSHVARLAHRRDLSWSPSF